MGLVWIALAAARAAEQGNSIEEVAGLARDLVSKSRIIFVVDCEADPLELRGTINPEVLDSDQWYQFYQKTLVKDVG